MIIATAKDLPTPGILNAFICHPSELFFTEEKIYLQQDGQLIPIDVMYRFFELFDLPNIPKQELILYAARHKKIIITPPPKAQLEEKLLFWLFHT